MGRPQKAPEPDFIPTARTKIKRLHQRAHYDRKTVYEILDAGLVCHVGYVIDGQPYVTPTAYWRSDDRVYWHGSSASKMLRHVKTGIPVCFTVSLLDGLVLARSGFHSSINYRAVLALGEATLIENNDAKLAALEDFMERLTPGRWAEVRPVTDQELKATTLVAMTLEEVAAKVRTGPPADDEEDYDLDVWAGDLPFETKTMAPVPDPRLKDGIAAPDYLRTLKLG